MWPNTVLMDLLDIEKPIVQAPMILQKPLAPLAISVCKAGGLGSIGCVEMSLEELEQTVQELRRETKGRPFNLNFFAHKEPEYQENVDNYILEKMLPFYKQIGFSGSPNSRSVPFSSFSDETLELLVKHKVPVVSFHFGIPSFQAIRQLKSSGTILMATATTVAEAKELERQGIDVIVAQGWEAGGHRGSFESNSEGTGIGTLALVPQIVDAVDVPVIASGGIGDGRGAAAAFILGACGVWMGTAFLTCTETPITQQHRDTILRAGDEDTHLTRAFSGRPCRAKTTPYSQEMLKGHQFLPDFPTMYNFSGPLKKYGITENDADYQFFLYGQAASLNQETSAKELIERITSEVSVALGGSILE